MASRATPRKESENRCYENPRLVKKSRTEYEDCSAEDVTSCGNCSETIPFGGSRKLANVGDDDALLVKELNSLSVQERENVYDEIHGVAKIPEESFHFLEKSFKELKNEIDQLPRGMRRALDRAMFLKPTLERDRKFQLMFLRADRFDAFYAARRMARYFENKLQLFGEEKLVKEIELSDMQDTDDTEAFGSAAFHVLPKKDRAGRSLWFHAVTNTISQPWRNCTRYFWYQLMTMLEDESAQRNGLAVVTYFLGVSKLDSGFFEFVRHGAPFIEALPLRICGIHFCFDDLRLKPLFALLNMCLKKEERIRIRSHFGSELEIRYALLTFGIPSETLPLDNNGKVERAKYDAYLIHRKQLEEERRQQKNERENQTMLMSYPNPRDVLVGRGRPYQEFPGNISLSHVVCSYKESYQQATERFGKLCIVMDIIQSIRGTGGRFLQRTTNGWEEASDVSVKDKVRSALRTKISSKPGIAADNIKS